MKKPADETVACRWCGRPMSLSEYQAIEAELQREAREAWRAGDWSLLPFGDEPSPSEAVAEGDDTQP